MAEEAEYVPAFMVELAANHDGRFDWRDHFHRTLVQLDEPLVDPKVQPIASTGVLSGARSVFCARPMSTASLSPGGTRRLGRSPSPAQSRRRPAATPLSSRWTR